MGDPLENLMNIIFLCFHELRGGCPPPIFCHFLEGGCTPIYFHYLGVPPHRFPFIDLEGPPPSFSIYTHILINDVVLVPRAKMEKHGGGTPALCEKCEIIRKWKMMVFCSQKKDLDLWRQKSEVGGNEYSVGWMGMVPPIP